MTPKSNPEEWSLVAQEMGAGAIAGAIPCSAKPV